MIEWVWGKKDNYESASMRRDKKQKMCENLLQERQNEIDGENVTREIQQDTVSQPF